MGFYTFDFEGIITRTAIVPGYTDSNGDWVPEQIATSTITGHVTDHTLQELQYVPVGLIELVLEGLTTVDTLELIDRIEIDPEEYEVTQMSHTMHSCQMKKVKDHFNNRYRSL